MAKDYKLYESISLILCQMRCTSPSFFEELIEDMNRRGYTIEAHQRGINGTYLKIVKLEKSNET